MGWRTSVIGAVDFTASNGLQKDHTSLHYFGKFGQNQYETAIEQIITALEPNIKERSYPFFGFGGVPTYMGATEVSHCFPLNGNIADPTIEGCESVIANYREKLPLINFAGPTLYGPLLEQFMDYVQTNKANKIYSILLMVTDGLADDFSRAKDILVQLSALPASVVIVGVGNANFDKMEELDGDDKKLTTDMGFSCHRDIVNFVSFKDAQLKGDMGAQVLKEIPDQVCSYMRLMGFNLQVEKQQDPELSTDEDMKEPLIEKNKSGPIITGDDNDLTEKLIQQ